MQRRNHFHEFREPRQPRDSPPPWPDHEPLDQPPPWPDNALVSPESCHVLEAQESDHALAPQSAFFFWRRSGPHPLRSAPSALFFKASFDLRVALLPPRKTNRGICAPLAKYSPRGSNCLTSQSFCLEGGSAGQFHDSSPISVSMSCGNMALASFFVLGNEIGVTWGKHAQLC